MNNKFIKKLSCDDFSDGELNYSTLKFEETRWRHSTIDAEQKYKNFDSFSNFNNNQKKNKYDIKDIKNKKKLLCNNIITEGLCGYGSKCMYAHSLAEQQIEPNRKNAYDILFSSCDLSHINFQTDINLFRSLRDLTKMCDKEHCTGGYNCKHGACGYLSKHKNSNKKYHVCIKDLEYGDCIDQQCESVHLTKRGLRPYFSGYTSDSISNIVSNHILGTNKHQTSGTLLTMDFFKNDSDQRKKEKEQKELKENQDNIRDDISEISLDSDISETIDEYNQSIFDEPVQTADFLKDQMQNITNFFIGNTKN